MTIRIETKDIQSLVFSGHGRLRQSLAVGLCVTDRASARAGLRNVVENEITFGLSRGIRTRGVQLLLSASGIRTLDAGESRLSDFSFAFKQGIITPQRSRALGDSGRSDPSTWSWQDQNLHVLFLFYSGEEATVRGDSQKLLQQLGSGWNKTFELPICLPADSREHFGFRDGISNARIDPGNGSAAEPGVDLLPPGEVLLGHMTAEGTILPPPSLGIDGAFVVVRQLEQDVQGFWRYWRNQSRTETEAIWLASKAIGRWPNGMPMRSSVSEAEPVSIEKEVLRHLTFGADSSGQGCPFGAHIRRANPRDGLVADPALSQSMVSHHRLIRRGRMYGTSAHADWYPRLLGRPIHNRDEGSAGGRGILFMALCADLGQQFEFVQQTWLKNPKFLDLHDEVDPISAGQGIPSDAKRFSIPGCPVRRRLHDVEGWVTVRGGGYFLLPGRSALQQWLARSGQTSGS